MSRDGDRALLKIWSHLEAQFCIGAPPAGTLIHHQPHLSVCLYVRSQRRRKSSSGSHSPSDVTSCCILNILNMFYDFAAGLCYPNCTNCWTVFARVTLSDSNDYCCLWLFRRWHHQQRTNQIPHHVSVRCFYPEWQRLIVVLLFSTNRKPEDASTLLQTNKPSCNVII